MPFLPLPLTSAGSQFYGFEDIHAEHPTDEFEAWRYAQFRVGTWKARIAVESEMLNEAKALHT